MRWACRVAGALDRRLDHRVRPPRPRRRATVDLRPACADLVGPFGAGRRDVEPASASAAAWISCARAAARERNCSKVSVSRPGHGRRPGDAGVEIGQLDGGEANLIGHRLAWMKLAFHGGCSSGSAAWPWSPGIAEHGVVADAKRQAVSPCTAPQARPPPGGCRRAARAPGRARRGNRRRRNRRRAPRAADRRTPVGQVPRQFGQQRPRSHVSAGERSLHLRRRREQGLRLGDEQAAIASPARSVSRSTPRSRGRRGRAPAATGRAHMSAETRARPARPRAAACARRRRRPRHGGRRSPPWSSSGRASPRGEQPGAGAGHGAAMHASSEPSRPPDVDRSISRLSRVAGSMLMVSAPAARRGGAGPEPAALRGLQ